MKTAILLCSMGGPDSLDSVKPFLFNLFNDPAILRLPQPLRYGLARLLAFARASEAQKIYAQLGGASPLLAHTQAQAEALQNLLAYQGDYRCFIGMSYWHPLIDETIRAIGAYAPDHLIIVPLYPQSSTTTTASVFRDVDEALKRNRISCRKSLVKAFGQEEWFIASVIERLKPVYAQARTFGLPRVLFSAHGLPLSIVRAGDTYPDQCAACVALLKRFWDGPPLESVLCYQSKVGPMRWTGPSTESEIGRAAKEGHPLVVVPLAFVCEHSETLIELAQDGRRRALALGAPFYGVAETVGTLPRFINGMAEALSKINQNSPET